MRFTDQTLIDILNTMRVPGGKTLTEQQWQALTNTEIRAEQPDVPATWYHSCYCWSVISMASFMLARQSAREACQTLFYVQAVDQAKAIVPETNTAQFYEDLLRIPSIQKTKRLPPVVLFHYGMTVRLATTIQQPLLCRMSKASLSVSTRTLPTSARNPDSTHQPFRTPWILLVLSCPRPSMYSWMIVLSSSCHQRLVRNIPSASQRAIIAPTLHGPVSWPSDP